MAALEFGASHHAAARMGVMRICQYATHAEALKSLFTGPICTHHALGRIAFCQPWSVKT